MGDGQECQICRRSRLTCECPRDQKITDLRDLMREDRSYLLRILPAALECYRQSLTDPLERGNVANLQLILMAE